MSRRIAWQGFRLLLRVSLAIAMIRLGIYKVIPVQIPPPELSTYLLRVGELTPARMLATFLGYSPAYQSFTGVAELLGGVLLLARRTALLGALISAANLVMACALALCYGAPWKLPSLLLLLMAVTLIVPDLRRLADLLVFDRAVEPAEETRSRFDRLVPLLGLAVIVWSSAGAMREYRQLDRTKPPLHGVWNVEEGPDTWRRVIFEKPGVLDVEHAIGSRTSYRLDPGRLMFDRPEPGVLLLDGELNGLRTRAKLRRMNLLGDRFHWILELEEEE